MCNCDVFLVNLGGTLILNHTPNGSLISAPLFLLTEHSCCYISQHRNLNTMSDFCGGGVLQVQGQGA